MVRWSSWNSTLFRELWDLGKPIGCFPYLLIGFSLALFKYLVEWWTIKVLTHETYTVQDFLNPLLSNKAEFLEGAPEWLGVSWVLWTLPFLAIAATLSVRRSLDAGYSPWLGFLVLVPILNLPSMVVLGLLPSRRKSDAKEIADPFDQPSELGRAFRPPEATPWPKSSSKPTDSVIASLIGIGVGLSYLMAMIGLSVFVLGSYGSAMFFGAPMITCAASSFFLNRKFRVSLGFTLFHATITLGIASLSLLVFAIEGLICVLMAIPIMLPLGLLGSFVGRAIATSLHRTGHSEGTGLVACMGILPLLAIIESQIASVPELKVSTSIEIDATMEETWVGVIEFPEITREPGWLFQAGVAYPIRAKIDGEGVGAVRHCEFSTGAFVEPITHWEAPSHLAFDVTDQPDPMLELSPYQHLHPPHLDHSFRSRRGEFRLVSIGEGKTRLEGTTWYELDIRPVNYWSLWTDSIVHSIHRRVLEHIKETVEQRKVVQ